MDVPMKVIKEKVNSNMMSKRSETSHEVWNARSSYQNGMMSINETQSALKPVSTLQSIVMTPMPDDALTKDKKRTGTEQLK